jgi:TRAP-type C4-dicarboxylate transport system permease small subunit
MKFIKKIDAILAKVLFALVQLCVVMLLLMLSAQIISRFFRIQFLSPQDEIINLFFAWFVFIGVALLFREGAHLRVEFVDGFMSRHPKIQSYYALFLHLCQAFFIGIFFSSSLNLYIDSGQRTSPMLHFPQRLWYGSLLCSAILMSLYLLGKFIVDIGNIVDKNNIKGVQS